MELKVKPEDLYLLIAEQAAHSMALTLILRNVAANDRRLGLDPREHAREWNEVGREGLAQTPFAVPSADVETVREMAMARFDELIATGLR